MWTRRDWIKLAATGTVATPLVSCAPARSGRPRNIILMVSDGMSRGVPGLATMFAQAVGRPATAWDRLMGDPRTISGQFDMASLDSPVPDSAAAASSWGSGHRVSNRSINILPEGKVCSALCGLIRATGRRTGLITTARVTHATPAGFAAAVPHRDYEDDIAPQYLGTVDVLMGGGSCYFDPLYRLDGQDLVGRFRQAGYTVATKPGSLDGLRPGEKVLGLFDIDHLPYVIDQQHDPASAGRPSLAVMTRAALRALDGGPGFFLMVEGARIDHAAHLNDTAGLLWEQLAFDDALAVVLDFCADQPDTLLVVTTDHGNAGPVLNGMGTDYAESGDLFARLVRFRESVGHFLEWARSPRNHPPAVLAARLEQATGIAFQPDEVAALARLLGGQSVPEWNSQHRRIEGILGQIVGNYTGIGWTGTSHTAEPAPLLALGPASPRFHGPLRNTDFFHLVSEFWTLAR